LKKANENKETMNEETKENQDNYHKLDQEHKDLVILRLAEFHTSPDIQKEIRESFGIKVTDQAIDYYREEKKALIQKKRQELNLYLDNIPCANKSIRLKQIQKRLNHLAKFDSLDKDSQKLELDLMEQARKEREGLKASIGVHRDQDQDALDKIQTESEVDQLIELQEKKERGEL